MEKDEDKFSDLNKKEKSLIIGSITFLIIISFIFIFFAYVGVFRLIGVEYTSRTALLLFFYYFLF